MPITFAVRGPVALPAGGGTAPVVDASAVATGAVSSTTTIPTNATSLNTLTANEIIVAIIMCENVGSGSVTTVSSISDDTVGGPLTWTKRSQFSFQSTPAAQDFIDIEVWWASTTSTHSGRTVTATTAATFDNAAIICFGVSGCGNPGSPWDANGSLPATANSGSAGIPTISGVSTTANGTLAIMAAGTSKTAAGNANQTAGTGFTLAASVLSQAGAERSFGAGQYEAFTTAQSSITVAFGTSWDGWIASVDALVGT